jgi:transposase-like protein
MDTDWQLQGDVNMPQKQSDRVTRALKLVASGYTIRDAATVAGCSKEAICRARKRAGADPLPLGRRATK